MPCKIEILLDILFGCLIGFVRRIDGFLRSLFSKWNKESSGAQCPRRISGTSAESLGVFGPRIEERKKGENKTARN